MNIYTLLLTIMALLCLIVQQVRWAQDRRRPYMQGPTVFDVIVTVTGIFSAVGAAYTYGN